MFATIATIDLKITHENYLFVSEVYPAYSERYLYFLATCLHLDPNIDLNIALKLLPYGGIIGIDNSSLDKYLKSFKILRLHAILHHAAGFVHEFSKKGLIRFALSSHKRVSWSRDWPCILFLRENFQKAIVQYVGMLKSRAVVLDFEGFWKKSGFIVKELAIATENFIDIISFLPPNSYRTLSSNDQKSYQWVSKFLHGLLWETGDYPYCYLQQIIDSIILRFPLAAFYAKRKEKTSTLTQLLQKNVINLETLPCPKVEHLKLYRETPICNLHALSCPKRQKSRYCARKKALLFYHWLMNESTSREDKSIIASSEFISKFDSLQLHSARQSINCNTSQGGKN